MAPGMEVHAGLLGGYLYLPAGVSGDSSLAGGAGQMSQEKQSVCWEGKVKAPIPQLPSALGAGDMGTREPRLGGLPRQLTLQGIPT